MKGRIKTIWVDGNHKPQWGFITGEDGVDYHFERRDSLNWKGTWRKDYIVEFDPDINSREDSKWYKQPIAVNVRKIGYGKNHPMVGKVKDIGDLLLSYIPDDDPKKHYAMRDLDAIYQYFCNVEDAAYN